MIVLFRFVSTEEKKALGTKRDNEVLIQRGKDGGLTVPYRIIDNPAKLTQEDWLEPIAFKLKFSVITSVVLHFPEHF